ncbi:MAG: hypothetical protein DRI77_00535 [Chloroflexi bacterium]|nr:MAG: hypothetical protein DRI77_00535 [Chloroflexota bacterium]
MDILLRLTNSWFYSSGKRPSDHEVMIDELLRISQLVTDFPEIVELDINPLMVFEEGHGAMAIDMRLVLAP